MSIDFYYAILTGWSILLFFWTIILLFVYFRKPLKSKLILKLVVQSLILFCLGYIVIFIFS